MRVNGRKLLSRWGIFLAGAFLVSSLGTVRASHASQGSIHGVVSVMASCQSCHVEGKPDAGGLNPKPTDGNENKGEWPAELLKPPSNQAAADAGKLRVHRFVPWNSFLLDKLTGDLKDGEGEAMRGSIHPHGAGIGGSAEIERCPGLIDELSNWILGGAPAGDTIVRGDFDWPLIYCERIQQPMGSLAAPAAGYQVEVDDFLVERPEREAYRLLEAVEVGNADPAWVNRIEILASAGTESVAVWRTGDDAPLVVARGQRDPSRPYNRWNGAGEWEPDVERVILDVTLPEGVAIELSGGQTVTIEHRIRNDYWIAPNASEGEELYRNRTVGDLVVNFHTIPASSVQSEARPVIDTTGTELLVTPSDLVGVTGGAWQGGFSGGLFGLWIDKRTIATALTVPASTPPATHVAANTSVIGEDATHGYAPVVPQDPTQQVVAYTCAHANGISDGALPQGPRQSLAFAMPIVSRPARYACIEGEADVADILQSGPREVCYRASDCEAPATCQPVPLVGGDNVDDGRCTLIGLVW